ncbi:MAG: hypothetical protein A2086_14240 [Spirochaetes bacterium GWD1_27_9]|nr:MAG: hypothetical protein A2Z98_09280 [Spirochaetes bacterium GWB1_27_13]OHD23673.1 MAG: hypothetical protein A2Y34_15420 [Spirochaetes bacterium GWC1_27_15]OHD29884.1 MAG: hypothetical protein A2086_14240 [Spirochaetes bacterium GWD1_27_9]
MSDVTQQTKKHYIPFVGKIFFGIILVIILAVVLGIVVMLIWNYLMPDLFGLKQINYLQAILLVLLCKILFGNFHHKKYHDHHKKYHKFWDKKGENKCKDFVNDISDNKKD